MQTLNIVLIDTFDLGDNVYGIEIEDGDRILNTGLIFGCNGDSDFVLKTAKEFLSDKIKNITH